MFVLFLIAASKFILLIDFRDWAITIEQFIVPSFASPNVLPSFALDYGKIINALYNEALSG